MDPDALLACHGRTTASMSRRAAVRLRRWQRARWPLQPMGAPRRDWRAPVKGDDGRLRHDDLQRGDRT
jgi:hypothetical protein